MTTASLDGSSVALNRSVILSSIAKTAGELTQNCLYVADMGISENYRVVKGLVVSAGPKARDAGIEEGDVVLYDKHSAFATSYHRNGTRNAGEFVITDLINVIVKIKKGQE